MGFLSGRMAFTRFQVQGPALRQFGDEQIQTLQKFAIGQIETAAAEIATVGFLGGRHLFDLDFGLEKNVINGALHASIRIDTNKVPGPLRKAWLEMELAAAAVDNPSGRPTRAQRQQAQEAVQARCEEESGSGRFCRMQQIPFLWDAGQETLYCGSSSPTVHEHLRELLERAFGLELAQITSGTLAEQLAAAKGWSKAFDKLAPSRFSAADSVEQVAWLTQQPESVDYLGNEFLLWLWWCLETQSEVISLPDGTSVTGMLNRSLALECPRGETGKESMTADAPTRLPESIQAIRGGKLPRKTGMTLVRNGEQYDFGLQAESLAVSGAAIQSTEDDKGRGALDERVESIRRLSETVDLLFEAFCVRRLGRGWRGDLEQIQGWLQKGPPASKRRAS